MRTVQQKHPWELLPGLVEADILSKEQARDLVLSHLNVHKRAIAEIKAEASEMVRREELTPDGFQRLNMIIGRTAFEELPDWAA